MKKIKIFTVLSLLSVLLMGSLVTEASSTLRGGVTTSYGYGSTTGHTVVYCAETLLYVTDIAGKVDYHPIVQVGNRRNTTYNYAGVEARATKYGRYVKAEVDHYVKFPTSVTTKTNFYN